MIDEVFEEEENIIDDTISNFENIFTQAAEKESFQQRRKKRNTIEMFDDMYDALDITVVEKVSERVEELSPDTCLNLLESVNTDLSTADTQVMNLL